MVKVNGNDKFGLKIAGLVCFIIGLFFVSFLIGRYSIHPKVVLDIILSNFIDIQEYWQDDLDAVVMQVRLPRIILALLVGGALSVSGASYQTLFKNPMASPDILGVSAGAGFGASLAILYSSNWWQTQLSAFVFGMIAVISTYLIAKVFADQAITVLILAGIVVSSFFQALISIVKTLAETDTLLPSITFWLMGSLGKGTNESVLLMLPTLSISLAVLFIFRHHINALAAGEDVAFTMGVNVRLIKTITVCCSTLMTVSAVSICGIIGWVGMVVPHISRMLTGSSFPKLTITSFLVGGSFLLIIDNVIRGVKGAELPIGVLTALVGTPVFILLLSRVKKGWS